MKRPAVESCFDCEGDWFDYKPVPVAISREAMESALVRSGGGPADLVWANANAIANAALLDTDANPQKS